MAQWLSWLERRPVTAEVVSSSLIWVVTSFDVMMYNLIIWGLSSAGRASALQAEGHRFEPYRSHLYSRKLLSADVAQLAEQLICNQQVIGSSPIIGFSNKINIIAGWSSLEARRAHNPKVVGSNPAPAI